MTEEILTGYPSIDKPWLKKYYSDMIEKSIEPKTIYRNIYDNNKNHLNETAILFKGFRINYGKMFDDTEKIACALKAFGIGVGDVVNMCVSMVPEAVCLLLACNKIGALANFINPLFTTEQKVELLNETDGKLLIILDAMFSYMEEAVPNINMEKIVILPAVASLPLPIRLWANIKQKNERLSVFCRTSKKYLSWKKFLDSGNLFDDETEAAYESERPAVMVYSSGTTGASKGIVLTNDGICATISHYNSDEFIYDRGDTFLSIVPIWFSTGNILCMLMPICLGISVILEPVFNKENFVKDILQYKPNMTLGATGLWTHLIHCVEAKNADMSFFKYPIIGGERVLPEAEHKINVFLKKHNCVSSIIKGYGMCELGSTVTTTSAKHSKLESVGYPIKKVYIAAFDLVTNEEMPYGKRGELRVCSAAHMKGYFKNSQATEEFFKQDASGNLWGCTGDIGYVDEDGDVFICGRTSDCFIAEDGSCVYYFDIEAAILEETAVMDCKTIQTEDKKLVAHIICGDSYSGKEDDLIKNLCARCEKLPCHARPTHYKLRDDFPVHANGKRDNESLRKDEENLIRV